MGMTCLRMLQTRLIAQEQLLLSRLQEAQEAPQRRFGEDGQVDRESGKRE